MPDPRFFEDLEPVTLAELASLAGAELTDPDKGRQTVNGVAVLARATADTVTFLTDRKYAHELANVQPGAIFLSPADRELAPPGCVVLATRTPHAAYAMAATRLHRARTHQGADRVSPEALIEPNVDLGPGVVVGPGARIGEGTRIGANTVIGPGVAIGRNCTIGANVTIGFALIGDRVSVAAGAVIGEPGFGATGDGKGVIDVPQLGRVIVQEAVSIGANTCVDRGAFEDTVIGENTKIDNMVQIAHNVRVGRNCVMAAYTGVSGSVVIGDGVACGGRVGIADHVTIGDGAQLAAAAGVFRNVPAGETWGGSPAQPVRRWMREVAWLARMANRKETRQ